MSSAAVSGERREPYLVGELAQMWRVAPSTVYRMIYAGRLAAERHGPAGKAIRVTAAAVEQYLAGVAAA
jgi:excisionase family DNA binding protein